MDYYSIFRIKSILIILSNILIFINSKNCLKNESIYKDNKCQLIYCNESEFENKTCIIANNVTKIQWLNNLLILTNKSYNYVNIIIDLQGNLFISSTPLGESDTSSILKERSFYGIKSNGHPLFYDNSTQKYYSIKKLYFDTPINYKREAEIINIKICNNTNYYFSPGKR